MNRPLLCDIHANNVEMPKAICWQCYQNEAISLKNKVDDAHAENEALKARVAALESGLDRVLTQLQLLANMSTEPLFEQTIIEFSKQVGMVLEGGVE